jgi:hypothetical protein
VCPFRFKVKSAMDRNFAHKGGMEGEEMWRWKENGERREGRSVEGSQKQTRPTLLAEGSGVVLRPTIVRMFSPQSGRPVTVVDLCVLASLVCPWCASLVTGTSPDVAPRGTIAGTFNFTSGWPKTERDA